MVTWDQSKKINALSKKKRKKINPTDPLVVSYYYGENYVGPEKKKRCPNRRKKKQFVFFPGGCGDGRQLPRLQPREAP